MSTKPQIKLNFHEMRKMTSLFSAIVNTSSNLQGKKEGKVKIPSLHKRITLDKNLKNIGVPCNYTSRFYRRKIY